MRILLLVSLMISASAFAQIDENGDSDTFGGGTTYYELGANYSFLRQENFWEGGSFIDSRDNLVWTGFDDNDEPIDEIIVIGSRRQLGAYFELSAELEFGDMFNRVCDGYTDGGHCNSYDTIVNVETWPLANVCQTVSGTMGPITGEEANGLNLEYQQNVAAASGAAGIGASLGVAALTAGQSAWL